jgi:hypothetical protein
MTTTTIAALSELEELQFIPVNPTPVSTPSSSRSSTPKKKTEKLIIFNDEIMERLTKDKNPATILIKNSKCLDDEVILAILLKYNFIIYECAAPSCTVKTSWRRKPIKLVINRKNSKQNDLRIDNLELLCSNCFSQTYGGTQILKQVIQQKIQCCRICNYDKVHLLGEMYRSSGYCTLCYKKMQDAQNSTNTVIKTDLLLYKSIESASSGGIDIELSSDVTKSLSDGIRDLMPKTMDLRDVASFMGASVGYSKSLKSKVRKIRTPKHSDATTTSSESKIHINCLEDIDLSNLT